MKKTKNFNTLLEELAVLKKQLSEDFIFNGGEEGMMDNGMGPEQGADPSMMQQQQAMPQQMTQGDNEEEKAMHAQEVLEHEPIITKIREIAIEGLKKYADHPTSSLYSYFKSVLLDSDKVLEGGGKK